MPVETVDEVTIRRLSEQLDRIEAKLDSLAVPVMELGEFIAGLKAHPMFGTLMGG